MLIQSRMAQMGEMIAMIAHQWRQPLSAIAAISGTLSLDIMTDSYKKEFFDKQLKKISDLTQHLSGTIDDFRRFFEEDKKEVFDTLEHIVEGSLDIVRPMAENRGIKISTEYQSNEKLLMHPNELKQAVLNLLKNAQEVIEEKKIENARIEIKTYKDDNNCYLEIKDNAGGVPEDIIDKIFEPYFTTKGELNGTGLGLYMSYIIIKEHHKGSLSVQNQDKGACFRIELSRKTDKVVTGQA